MALQEHPQIYLITPTLMTLSTFTDQLSSVLDRCPVACLRVAFADSDERTLGTAADTLGELAHARDVAVVIDTHIALVQRHGLDGVHLPDSARSVRQARKDLGADAIIGAYCGASRDAGMTAGEAGADYVAFGPVGQTLLGTGRQAERALFEWWSEMIEIPVVAEGALTAALVEELSPVADFLAFGQEIWTHDDPAGELVRLLGPIRA